MELQVHGYELALRLAEAEQIEVEEISERTNSHSRGERLKPVDHPGLGEEGKYHPKKMRIHYRMEQCLLMPW